MTLTSDHFTDDEKDEASADLERFGTAFDLLENGGCDLDTDEPLTDKQIAACERVVNAYRQAQALVELEADREPGSCTHCGILEDGHARRWAPGIAWHTWTAPTDAQQLRRERATLAAECSEDWVVVGQEFRRILAEAKREASHG